MAARPSGDPDDITTPSGQPLDAKGDEGLGFERTRNSDPLIGRMLGEYQVLERLGHGGMGLLYRGVQPLIEKPVAIKVVLADIVAAPHIAERMLEEARAANAVRHPNIVDIFTMGTLPDGRPYMVMELLDGQPLSEVLRLKGRLSAQETITVLEQALAALTAAHAVGVVHRDLKPDNIFVTRGSDGGWAVKLIDFGLAKREGKDLKLTRPGMVMGTPGFMAPEQVRGDDFVTGKADVYAMGVVAWTLLMGREPFVAGSVVEILHKHLSEPMPALELAEDAPEGLVPLVARMMEKDATRRPDAAQARQALASLGTAPPAKASPLTVAVAAALMTLVLGLTSAGLWVALQSEDPAPVVVKEVRKPPPKEEPVTQLPSTPAPAEKPVTLPAGADEAWKCTGIVSVSGVKHDTTDKYLFYSIGLDYSPPLVVFIRNSRREDELALVKQRNDVATCAKTFRTLAARRLEKNHPGFNDRQFRSYRGTAVYWQDVWLAP